MMLVKPTGICLVWAVAVSWPVSAQTQPAGANAFTTAIVQPEIR